jgi:hypothetical protein
VDASPLTARPVAVTLAGRRPVAVALTGAALIVAALTGCGVRFGADPGHTAKPTAATSATATASADQQRVICAEQVAWNLRGKASVQVLYADTGALAADASAENLPGVTQAGRKLASDAIAAATLPLPPVGSGPWKVLTAAYAEAGTAIAAGNASGAVPQLEAGNSAISAFSAAIAKCSTARL